MNHKTQTEQEFQKLAVQIKERMIDNLNLNDDYYLDLGRRRFGHKRFERSLKIARGRAAEGKPYWEHIIGFRTTLNSGLVIYPTVNMIENVGTSANATHAPNNIAELPKEIQQIFTTPALDVEFPLKHPPYVIEDYHYFDTRIKYLDPGFFRKIKRKIEHLCRKIYIKLRKKK